VVGTADADGRPWVTPVFFTLAGYRELSWISEPGARHSRNIAARPEVSLVVFDSQVPVGFAKAVYLSGVAAEVTGAAVEPAAAAYNARSLAKGGQEIGYDEVQPTGRFRVYTAAVLGAWVLDPDRREEGRIAVTLD
jgi:hypothetical protein